MNTTYHAIIVEDELHSREFLKNMLATYCPAITLVGMADGVESAVQLIQAHKPDIIFLDIEMQTGTGFDLLLQFPNPSFDVIFTTAYDNYAIKAIKFSAVDYLLKPIDIEELQEAVQKVIAKKIDNSGNVALQMLLSNLQAPQQVLQRITLSTSDGMEFVPLHDIIYLEASGPYSHFFLKGGRKITVSRHLKEYEQLLADHQFFRIHNSYLIHMREVKKMVKQDGGYAIMSNDAQISISPKKKDEFLQLMARQLVN